MWRGIESLPPQPTRGMGERRMRERRTLPQRGPKSILVHFKFTLATVPYRQDSTVDDELTSTVKT